MRKIKIQINSLLMKLMIPMFILAILQGVIFYSVFIITDAFDEIRNKSIDAMCSTVSNRAAYIDNSLFAIRHQLDDQISKVNRVVNEAVKEFDIVAFDADTLTLDTAKIGYTSGRYGVFDLALDSFESDLLKQYVLKRVSSVLTDVIFNSKASGAYFILTNGSFDAPDLSGTRDGLYFRAADNKTANQKNQLVLSVGSEKAAQNYCSDFDFDTEADRFTSFNFTQSHFSDITFYTNTVCIARANLPVAAENGDSVFSKSYAFWSPAYAFGSNNIISYSLPLTMNDVVYAVIGIDISDVLYGHMLDRLMLNDDTSLSYLLTVRDVASGNDLHTFFDTGTVYRNVYGNSDGVLEIERKVDNGKAFYKLKTPKGASDIYAASTEMLLYGNSSPYDGIEWSLTAISHGDSLFEFPNRFQAIVIMSVAASVLLCVGAIAVISLYISRPVKRLSEEIKNNSSFENTFNKKTNIYEIDVFIDEIRQLTENLSESGLRLERIIELAKMPLGAYEFSEGDTKVFCTGRMHRLLNFSDKIVASGFMSLDEFRTKMELIQSNVYSTSEDGSEVVYRFADEMGFNWTRLYITNTAKSALGVAVDITAEFTEKRLLEHERDHDSMTQLLNRRAYYNSAYNLFKDTDTIGIAAVVMLDIDGLKYVNDTYGHDKGDRYIIATAKAIRAACGDRAVISRLAGDEFSFIIHGGKTKDEIREIAKAVMDNLRNTRVAFSEGVEQCIKASAGLAWFPDDALAFNKLLKYADYAMYQIKNTTKGKLAEFDYKKYDEEMRILQENEEFREIIAKQKIELLYQPIVSAERGTVFAYDMQYIGGLNFYKKQSELIRAAINTSLQYKIEDIVWTKIIDTLAEKNVNTFGAKIMFYSMADCMLSDRRFKELPDYKKHIGKLIIYSEADDIAVLKLKKELMEMYGGSIAINVGADGEDLLTPLSLEPGLLRVSAAALYDAYIDPDMRLQMLKSVDILKNSGNEVIAYDIETEEHYELMQSLGFKYLQGNFISAATPQPERQY